MDAALSFRAMHPVAPAVTARADAAPVPDAVPTVLPQPDRSVPATARYSAQDGVAARPRETRLLDEVLREFEREVDFDESAQELVSRAVDGTTGAVVAQYPSEALLKLRAYVAASDVAKSEPLVVRES